MLIAEPEVTAEEESVPNATEFPDNDIEKVGVTVAVTVIESFEITATAYVEVSMVAEAPVLVVIVPVLSEPAVLVVNVDVAENVKQ